jgi:DHA1 family bicyclomycin/chloramphenicol resistance-like MFS transporter
MLLVGTLICALAPNITVFMIGRVLQTATVAGFVLARAIVRDMVPLEKAASMIGYVTMGTSMVPMVGPTIGGLLNEFFGWQSNFLLLLALGVGALALAFADLGETNHKKSASFAAQFHAWPELFRSRHFWAYTLTATFSSGVFFCFLGGAPYVGSILYALTPSALGLFFFFCSAGYVFGNFLSGRYAGRFGTTAMMISGGAVTLGGIVLSMLLTVFDAHTPLAFFGPLSLVGIGNGLSLPSANAGIVSVKPHLAGSASGVGGAITIGGGAALSVLAGAVLSEDTGILPLLSVMLACAVLALVASVYGRRADRMRPLQGDRS